MTHFLFPDLNPPEFPHDASVQEGCTWLLAVMDLDDGARRFVASVMLYDLDRGYITEKQMGALRSIAVKVIRRRLDGDLECQGARPAEKQSIEFGSVIPLRAVPRGGDEVVLVE